MRAIIGVLLFTGVAGASQGEQPKPNTLTPKEAAEGWLLLFDGETTFGWTASASDKLTAKDGVLRFEGPGTLQTTTAFSEYALEFQCRITGSQAHDAVKLLFAQGYETKIGLPNDKKIDWRSMGFMLGESSFHLTITTEGGERGSGGGGGLGGSHGPQPTYKAGNIGFAIAAGAVLELRQVALNPLGQKPLFNGKNLDGWHEFKGPKYVSKFTVNDKLELNVKNGPGDLQTNGNYTDFLLQLDCLSNGKHLNSGVFFRCKPNEYQNGYECQIHNGWNAQADKVYSLEHFDPMTHKLIKTEKIKSAAIDGGTGGIYRRIPARKQVAKDFEWFTLTLAAHGNHMATWVNGVQVCDWTDNRPASDNPRNGCRLLGGHISIQGHDPTTDLSFRKLRIAVYPAAEKK